MEGPSVSAESPELSSPPEPIADGPASASDGPAAADGPASGTAVDETVAPAPAESGAAAFKASGVVGVAAVAGFFFF